MGEIGDVSSLLWPRVDYVVGSPWRVLSKQCQLNLAVMGVAGLGAGRTESGEGQREAAKLGEGHFSLLFTSQARGGNAYCLMPNFWN